MGWLHTGWTFSKKVVIFSLPELKVQLRIQRSQWAIAIYCEKDCQRKTTHAKSSWRKLYLDRSGRLAPQSTDTGRCFQLRVGLKSRLRYWQSSSPETSYWPSIPHTDGTKMLLLRKGQLLVTRLCFSVDLAGQGPRRARLRRGYQEVQMALHLSDESELIFEAQGLYCAWRRRETHKTKYVPSSRILSTWGSQ